MEELVKDSPVKVMTTKCNCLKRDKRVITLYRSIDPKIYFGKCSGCGCVHTKRARGKK